MQIIPIKTRVMEPPQDDVWSVLDTYLTDVREGDVVALSSKVVAIHEGRCIAKTSITKAALVVQEAELVIPRSYWSSPLTLKQGAFIGNAGVDESNANGYYVLLPTDPFASAKAVHEYLTKKFLLAQVGVLITDSHSEPLRRGASGVSIGWWGFKPTIDHRGEADLFGREIKVEVSNLADGLAAAATVVMGEVAECQPVVILRDVPSLTFIEGNTSAELIVPPQQDTFRVLYERFLT